MLHPVLLNISARILAFSRRVVSNRVYVFVMSHVQQYHMVLSVGAADGCAVSMAKNWMAISPELKHAVVLQVSTVGVCVCFLVRCFCFYSMQRPISAHYFPFC